MADTNVWEYDKELQNLIEETQEFLISDSLLRTLIISLSVILHGVISLAGVLSNSVNVLVFIRLGLKDSMSVGLWALSFTDLVVSTCQLFASTCYLIICIYPKLPLDLWSIGMGIFGWIRYVGYLISCWTTTIIAIERCYCVVAPFRVKQVFTKSRCVALVLLNYLIHFGVLIPIFAFEPLSWVQYTIGDKDENGTLIYFSQIQMVITKEGANWELIVHVLESVALSLPSQALILLCSFWMVFSLKASSKVRKHSVSQNEKKADNLSPRERILVKVVLQLAIIQTCCNIPRFITTGVFLLLPGLLLGAYVNIMTVMWELSYIFITICCTSNIFVYLKLNSSYRHQFSYVFTANINK